MTYSHKKSERYTPLRVGRERLDIWIRTQGYLYRLPTSWPGRRAAVVRIAGIALGPLTSSAVPVVPRFVPIHNVMGRFV